MVIQHEGVDSKAGVASPPRRSHVCPRPLTQSPRCVERVTQKKAQNSVYFILEMLYRPIYILFRFFLVIVSIILVSIITFLRDAKFQKAGDQSSWVLEVVESQQSPSGPHFTDEERDIHTEEGTDHSHTLGWA